MATRTRRDKDLFDFYVGQVATGYVAHAGIPLQNSMAEAAARIHAFVDALLDARVAEDVDERDAVSVLDEPMFEPMRRRPLGGA